MARIKTHICIDKLEITYSASNDWKDYYDSFAEGQVDKHDELFLERKPSKYYKSEFNVFCYDPEGDKRLIGLLYWGSFNKNRQKIYFSYSNEALYDDFLLASRFYIEEALGLNFENISKIDIAIDANVNVVKRFYKIYRDSTYDLILNGRKVTSDMDAYISDVEGHYVGSRNKPYKHKTFYVHNRDRSLELRAYNKSLEIQEESGKTYIEHHVGFGNLYRLEVSCKNHKQISKSLNALGIKYEDDIFCKLQFNPFLFSLFEEINKRLIRFSVNRKAYSLTELIFV